jgi:hypothetical protein
VVQRGGASGTLLPPVIPRGAPPPVVPREGAEVGGGAENCYGTVGRRELGPSGEPSGERSAASGRPSAARSAVSFRAKRAARSRGIMRVPSEGPLCRDDRDSSTRASPSLGMTMGAALARSETPTLSAVLRASAHPPRFRVESRCG